MTPTEKLEWEKRRGEDALRIIESDVFQDSVEQLKKTILQEWAASPMRDIEGREALHQMFRTVEAVRTNLVSIMQTGKMASMQLVDADRRRKPVGD